MKVRINGKEEMVSGKKNIAELISDKNLLPEHVVVEHNMQIISRDRWSATALNEDDNIEIVSFVGGG